MNIPSQEGLMYPDKKSVSWALNERARQFLPGGNTRHTVFYPPYPNYVLSGEGCRITDVDGVTRIDCVNNMSALIHGHANPAVHAALQQQMEHLLCAGAPTEAEIDLAEILVDRVPGIDRIRFANSGSEAIMFACRAARAYTGRNKIAKIEGAYHGSYDAVQFGLNPEPDAWGPAQAPATVGATRGLAQAVQQDTVTLPLNDINATRAILERHSDQLAAVLIDPLVSRMGFVPASQDYLDMVRQVTTETGMVLIFDEVFSFRIAYNGAQAAVGVTPDLTVLGKVIGGGMPIGAVGGKQAFMEVFDHTGGAPSVEHSGTYFANPMSMAAGMAALQQLTPAAHDRLNGLGTRLRRQLQEVLRETGVEGYVAGAGSLVAIILAKEVPTNYREMYACMSDGAKARGMILHRFLLNAGVQIIPPGAIVLSTAMDEDVLDEIVAAVRSGLKHVADNST